MASVEKKTGAKTQKRGRRTTKGKKKQGTRVDRKFRALLEQYHVKDELKELRELRQKRMSKLLEQTKLARELNSLISRHQKDSNAVRKSVEAAISVSRQPGYIDYVAPGVSMDVGPVRDLVEKLGRVEQEMKEIDLKLDALWKDHVRKANEQRESLKKSKKKSASTFDEWFAINGKPDVASLPKGMVSQFKRSGQYVPNYGTCSGSDVCGCFSHTLVMCAQDEPQMAKHRRTRHSREALG